MKLAEFIMKRREENKQIFMAHIYYGDPCQKFSFDMVDTLVKTGIDILEFGMPFSDPTADGPAFISACTRALKEGVALKDYFLALRKITSRYPNLPVVSTSYFNIVYNYGAKNFVADAKDAGAIGLIIPDLPVEESNELLCEKKNCGIDIIFIIGPNSPEDRIKKICENAGGFLYLTTACTVTGTREKLGSEIEKTLKLIRRYTSIPILAGFGISTKEHVKLVAESGSDGCIAGSFIAKIYEKYIDNNRIIDSEKCLLEISEKISELKNAKN